MENDSDDLTNLRINVENVKWAIIGTTQAILFKLFPQNAEALSKKFVKEYEDLLNSNDNEMMTDFEKLKRVRKKYAKALEKILNRDEVFNVFIDSIDRIYNMTLLGARRKARGEIRHIIDKGPILPGTDKSTDIVYFCSVCKQEFEIEPDEKKRILNSDEKLELKTHCGSPVKIKIISQALWNSVREIFSMYVKRNQSIYPWPNFLSYFSFCFFRILLMVSSDMFISFLMSRGSLSPYSLYAWMTMCSVVILRSLLFWGIWIFSSFSICSRIVSTNRQ